MTKTTKSIVKTAVLAAVYATLTLALAPISYGAIQFRISEIMVLLPFLGKEYILGLTLGCFLANVIGPYGVPDIILGTLATLISTYLVYLTSKIMKYSILSLIIASLWPALINAIIIGGMLNVFMGMPLILSMIQVGFGEFVVISIVGVPLFKIFYNKYGNLVKDVF
ncbi:QueT transporter family protein [Romboutsia maritimum]|uniref:QueT transporter family protein n=1 Tax=Romboutsia maritimum TaxID=2020948 RepID=A0A371ISP1_9FIRM|nr:QueT transporter family protein [Romboutsia maritimum]RDY23483.1 QueT transporter family protein [Romboutsia maritimum]